MVATAVSADGRTVVGMVEDPGHREAQLQTSHRPFVWRAGQAHSVALEHPFPDEVPPRTTPGALSGDGATLVGRATQYRSRQDGKVDTIFQAWAWREGTGFEMLKTPGDGLAGAHPRTVSFDGAVIAGDVSTYPAGYDGSVREKATFRIAGIIWENGKPELATDYLQQRGLDLDGWDVTRVFSISDDGTVLAGGAQREGQTGWSGWVASLRTDGIPVADKSAYFQAERTVPAKDDTEEIDAGKIESARVYRPPVPEPQPEPEPEPAPEPEQWEVVGYWDYDGADGQSLGAGLHAVQKPGENFGQKWSYHLEMIQHDQLPNRRRQLWPVYLNRLEGKVCAPYPNYPSYPATLDLPGDQYDGVYRFSGCTPD